MQHLNVKSLDSLVKSSEFKEWFGDWELPITRRTIDSGIDVITLENLYKKVSKILNKNDAPLLVYHNSNNLFGEFNPISEIGNKLTFGSYFTPQIEMYAEKGIYRYECFLNVKNPFVTNSFSYSRIVLEDKFDDLMDQNYDGIILKNDSGDILEIVIFDASQVWIEKVYETRLNLEIIL